MDPTLEYFLTKTCEIIDATSIKEEETIQQLWSGYGRIIRFSLIGCQRESVVVKHIKIPNSAKHPRGWNTDISHNRKIQSYEVEKIWYQDWTNHTDHKSYTPRCLEILVKNEQVFIILEDLNTSGYPLRKRSVSMKEVKTCISWLAHFHANFFDQKPENLWPIGTYWHLDTRPEEWDKLSDIPLKNAAKAIDQKLQDAKYQTIVHGDAKLANFCFSTDATQVAAVDFQYVGRGCGMKDLAYFIGSCLNEDDSEKWEKELLDYYFSILLKNLPQSYLNSAPDIEEEWRYLYPWAWTDFHRFLKGWSPGHWKINTYSEKMSQKVIKEIERSQKKE